MPGAAQAQVVLLGRLLVEAGARLARDPGGSAPALGLTAAEQTRRRRSTSRDDVVVVDVAGGRDHHVGPDVAGVVVLGDLRDGHRPDDLGGADDRAPERVVAEDGVGQHVVHLVRRLVLVHRDLLDHDLALGVDVGVRGAQHHVAHHVPGALEVLVEEPRVDVGRLLAGPGVDLRPHAVEELVDLQRRVAVGPLEQQVLEEVRDAGLLDPLVAGSGPDPEAERHGSDRGQSPRSRPVGRSPVR